MISAKAPWRPILISTAILLSGLTTSVAPSFADVKKPDNNDVAINFAQKSDPVVLIETTQGPIKVVLFKKDAPLTTANFLDLVQRNFYNGTTFHRYEPGFVIQGGDPQGTGRGNFIDPKTHKERHIKLEKKANLHHNAAGVLAMARTQDPDSASCQFYITLGPAAFLDEAPGYAVFGKVISGMDNVKKLRAGDKMKKVSLQK